MQPLVFKEDHAPPEGLPTGATFKRSLSSVDPLGSEKVGVLTEGFPTLGAVIGFPSHVHTVVFMRSELPLKDFPHLAQG